MSDRPIQVGDLVVVVRPLGCCFPSIALGKIFRVNEIDEKTVQCRKCRTLHIKSPAANVETNNWFPVWRLKRIPPLEELEGNRTDEQIKEPA